MADINSQLPTKITDGTLTATIRDVTGANDALNVAITKSDGTQVDTFGGGTQYTEDAVSVGGESLTLSGSVRRDTAASSAGTDGDYATINTDATGRIWTSTKIDTALPAGSNSIGIVDTELPAAVALADAASATQTTPTVGTISLVMNATTADRQRAVVAALDSTGIGIAAAGLVGQLDDTATATVTENQFAPVRISTRRALLVEGVASGTAIPTTATITNAESSPIPVYITSGAASATEVNDYNTAASVAASGTSNHSYTVTGATMLLKQLTFAASGRMKVELQVGPVAALVSKGVWFISTATPSFTITFAQPIEIPVASTGTVRLIRTNLEAVSQDVYSTIIGSNL